MSDQVMTLLLAGGEGRRLQPLTRDRAKPAVPFGGRYRIIDFALSNCLHSGFRRVLILTQYKSHSLHKHLRDGWSIFNPELGEYVTAVPPQMRVDAEWYQGTANAVFQNWYLVERSGADHVLVLSGDHVYRMDYAALVAAHQESGCDVTVACMKVPLAEAHQFGVMSVDENHRVTAFEEKPASPAAMPDDPANALVSMGIYVFRRDALGRTLHEEQEISSTARHDFGRDVIPHLLAHGTVHGYTFGGSSGRVSRDRYWRDVGTIDSYFAANMDLLHPVPALDLYQRDWPIRSHAPQYPPARTVSGASGNEGLVVNSIIGAGTVISGAAVSQCIAFPEVTIGDGAVVEQCILFEGVQVGRGARLRNCIVDKWGVIPEGFEAGYQTRSDAGRFDVSEGGVVVLPRGYRAD